MIVVWSLGGKLPAQQGLNVYGWATARTLAPVSQVRGVEAKLKEPSWSGLGPVTRVKDGWAFGRKFGCLETGRLLISRRRSREGARRRPRPEAAASVGSR